ncbi:MULTISPECIES: DUF1284 domain-containing protein [Aneurinibacillus]|jgi:hypothetical protein|uniref:DUF1284 domain-containing protein n=1 Tax=Aneurinibacillus thermoaerophilus TaxID=143495 RepID=A0ABX8YFF8_ANETH|nr:MULTISPECIES: DUF1284 domain-containing protein [Aneurinibacillus]AMA73620.1 hypothetical protein ACH33_12635 [Aneurinibacillus sp. XH2]MED0679583.1 DUF1284 domain-containing protein [Aneurinibacillus thermoaerophilus]MED0737418.1 DUF1284 domain-containing protein [Aneurinibacillus thermoaerophilus]MED0756267.1 DUF1284 domain-containing protein [Aneurinibacillus thermoaerophilus]MED0760298.1 DUF1284 domain-containing protein [Aneurinibacillus thermoaerophilus]
MEIRKLRGHHLLCVHGFQGMGYSPSFIKTMREMVECIRDPECDIRLEVTIGFDEVCGACPHKGQTKCEAGEDSDLHVRRMDAKVIRHLHIEPERTYSKKWLVQRTAQMVKPDDLDFLCLGCSWLSYGVCKEGIRRLKERYGDTEKE